MRGEENVRNEGIVREEENVREEEEIVSEQDPIETYSRDYIDGMLTLWAADMEVHFYCLASSSQMKLQ